MITVDQIRSMLQQLTLSQLSLDDFDEWLTGASWNMQQASSPEAISMVGQIEARLAEYEDGHISWETIIEAFGKMAVVPPPMPPIFSPFEMSNSRPMPAIVTSAMTADASVLNFPLRWSAASDKQPVSGFSYTLLRPTRQ